MQRAVALFAVVAACGGGPGLRPLGPGEAAPGPARGLGRRAVAAAGRLGYAVAFTGDGAGVASVELTTLFALVTRDAGGGRVIERRRIALGDAAWDVSGLAVAAGRAWVASADGTVRGYELASGAETVRWPLGDAATAVAASREGAWVATGDASGVICLRRAADGALLQCVAAHDARVAALAFSADGARLASASWDGRAIVWAVPSLAVVWTSPPRGSANDVALSPDGARLAIARSAAPPRRTPEVAARESRGLLTATADDVVEVWRVENENRGPATGNRQQAMTENRGPATGNGRIDADAAAGADADADAGAGADAAAAAAAAADAALLITLRGHDGPVVAVAWTPDGARLLTASWDRTLRLWDATTGTELARDARFVGLVRSLAVSLDGRLAAAAAWAPPGDGAAIVIYDLLYPR